MYHVQADTELLTFYAIATCGQLRTVDKPTHPFVL